MAKKQETKKPAAPKQATVVTKDLVPTMPDYMKEFQQTAQMDTGSMISASIGVPRLSYRGKRWRFMVDGDEEMMKELAIPVIIVGVEPDAGRFIKTFYSKTYTPGDTEPPDCSSSDGIQPDLWVTSPQSPRCAGCSKNVFGSAVSRKGGKAKACHDGKRLWIVRPEDPEFMYVLSIPIMSLKNLAEYGKYIARNNYPLTLVITELSLDDDAEFPKVCFKHTGFVDQESVQTVMELNTRRPWKSGITAPVLPPAPAQAQLTETAGKESLKRDGKGINDIIGDWK